MMRDDMTLVREFAASRSEPAFAALVARHLPLVHSAARRQVGDEHLAGEIAQAVFLILARKAATLGPKTILAAWLYRTTRYTAADALKTRRRRAAREQEAYMQSSLNQTDTDAWTQLAPVLDEALNELGETDRAALVLRYFENQSAGEMAAALRMKEAAVQKRVTRALEKLRARLVKRGVTLTATVIAGAVAANSVQAAPVGLTIKVSVLAAKGAVVATSITTLVKGTLKMMMWMKMKTGIVVGVIAGFIVGAAVVAERQPSGMEFKGTLKLVFPMAPGGPTTNLYSVRLLTKTPNWELSLTSLTANKRVLSSPQQTYSINLYDSPATGPLNTCEVSIMPGSRPLFNRMAEHVWLALLSGKTYIGQTLPLPDSGLGMHEPSMITAVKDTKREASPREMSWTNQFPNGRASHLEGQFRWLTSTNTPEGLNIPNASQMQIDLVDMDGNRKVTSYSELVIDSVVPSFKQPEIYPKILGRNVVYDYRLCDFLKSGGASTMKRYDVQDSKGLDKIPAISTK